MVNLYKIRNLVKKNHDKAKYIDGLVTQDKTKSSTTIAKFEEQK